MTATAIKKNYKATLILDTRGREETADQLVADLQKEIATLGIDVLKVENLGRREFARKTDPALPAGNYAQYDIAGGNDTATRLQNHFRLNPLVYRVLVQGV
jgi:small subunit ribosomal protein S6